jgi:hypothetical protein
MVQDLQDSDPGGAAEGNWFTDDNWKKDGKLYPSEKFWVDNQPWLKDRGYTLRARYQPDWVASWSKPNANTTWFNAEDALVSLVRGSLNIRIFPLKQLFSACTPLRFISGRRVACNAQVHQAF